MPTTPGRPGIPPGGTFVTDEELVAAFATLSQVNVLDHSPAADGVTDDTAAFESAEAEAYNAGCGLFVPAGTYLLESDLALRCSLMGAGHDSTIIDGATLEVMADGITLSDFTLNTSAAYAIHNYDDPAGGFDRLTVRDVTVSHTATQTSSLYAKGCSGLTVRDCRFQTEGIQLSGVTEFVISGNVFDFGYTNTSEGVHASRGSSGVITENTFLESAESIVDLFSSGERCVVANNRAIGIKTNAGIMVKVVLSDDPQNSSDPPDDVIDGVVISGNVLKDFIPTSGLIRYGIFVDQYDSRAEPEFTLEQPPRGVVVSGNVLQDFMVADPGYGAAYYIGISVTANNCIISDNIIRNIGHHGGVASQGIGVGTASAEIDMALFNETVGCRITGNVISGIENGYGINLGRVRLCSISDNIIRTDDPTSKTITYGIATQADELVTVTDCIISDNIIECASTGGFGVQFHTTPVITRTVFSGNVLTSCGFRVSGQVLDSTFQGNRVQFSTTTGYVVGVSESASRNISFIGNHVTSTSDYGLVMTDVDGFTIVGNTFRDTTRAVWLFDATRNGVLDCNISIGQTGGSEFPHYSGVSGGDQATITTGTNKVIE